MRRVRGRSFVAVLAVAIVASACQSTPESARPTTLVAAETGIPTPEPTALVATPPPPSPEPTGPEPTGPEPTGPVPTGPAPTPDPNVDAPSAIEPGQVNRSSLDLSATYDVNALISVGTGAIEMAARIEVTNESGDGIDRLELNTIAAKLGGIKVTESSVDGERVKTKVRDQTLVMPLGGVLPDGASATILIGYRASLRPSLAGSDWMFSNVSGSIAMHRWIPWVSKRIPSGRPNDGLPFVTTSSPSVEVEIVTDTPMVLASPAADVAKLTAGRGQAWSFTVENVRDVSVALAPDFGVLEGAVQGIPVRVYSRYGAFNRDRLLGLAEAAVRADAGMLGIDYPWTVLTVVETEGGDSLAAPGLIWVPKNLDPLNQTYAVHHVVAHQWFNGLVGSNQRTDPFAGDGMADLLARSATANFRPSSCPATRLDLAITGYTAGCYYETVQVQGGLVLDSIRQQMGANRFWEAVRGYLRDYRYGIAGTKELLDALRDGSDASIGAILRARFPGLY